MATAEMYLKTSVAVLSRVPKLMPHLKDILPTTEFQEIALGQSNSNFDPLHPEAGLPDYSLKQLQEAEVIIADYNLISPHLYNLPKTKWIQGTWAGADAIFTAIDPKKPSLPYIITRFSGDCFGYQMAEYVVAMVVNKERKLLKYWESQQSHHWEKADMFHASERSIQNLTFTILGLGNIGNRVASVLHALGATVWGVGRSERDSLPTYINEYRTLSGAGLGEALAAADYVVNVLPGTSGTAGLLGGTTLQACAARRAVLVNIGRGSVVSEADLLRALRERWLRGAVLDVLPQEPLPPDSALWDEPQVLITPHMAGVTQPQDVAQFFRKNLERYLKGQTLLYPLDFEKRY